MSDTIFYKPQNPVAGYDPQTVFNAQGQGLSYDQYIQQGGTPNFSNVKTVPSLPNQPTAQTPQAPTSTQPNQPPQSNQPAQSSNPFALSQVMTALDAQYKTNNSLMTNRNIALNALYGMPVSADDLNKLDPTLKQVLQSGDKNQIEMQIRLINDQVTGRANTLDQSIQYLTTAYQQQQQQLEAKRQEAVGTFTDFLSKFVNPATGKSDPQAAGQYLTQLYGADNLKAMGIDVNNLEQSIGSLQPLSAFTSTLHYGDPGTTGAPGTGGAQGVSSLGNLLNYYTHGDPSSPVGSGYSGAVLKALQGTGLTLDSPASQLQQYIPQIAEGIIKGEGSPGLEKAANAGAAILWSTAKSYGFDSKYGATPFKASNGTTYAGFPDHQTEVTALQNLLGQYIGSGQQSVSPLVQSYVDNITNGNMTMQQVPTKDRPATSIALDNTSKTSYSPIAESRLTTAATKLVAPYLDSSQYKLTADGAPYIQRIAAAMQTPGSISDQDLLDSLTKLNTGGNAISDAQVSLITNGQSFSDTLDVAKNKLSTGGVLSDNQRQQIQKIANAIYTNYQIGYQSLYDTATQGLSEAGIPKPFWTVIPDWNKISGSSGLGSSSTSSGSTGGTTYNSSDDILKKYELK